VLLKRLHETVTGNSRPMRDRRPLQPRAFSFNKYPELRRIIAHMSDADIDRLAAAATTR